MSMIRRTSQLGEIVSLRNAMDRLFDESLWRPTWVARGLEEYPIPLDVETNADAVVVKAALPGDGARTKVVGIGPEASGPEASASGGSDAGQR